jgi:hypothetical protein
MAFTDSQRSKIRTYLGYPDRFLSYSGNIENAIDFFGEDVSLQEEVEDILSDLEIIDTAIMSGRSVAGIKSAGQGDVEFYESGKISDLKRTGNWLINSLAIKMGISCARPYYGIDINIPPGFACGFI